MSVYKSSRDAIANKRSIMNQIPRYQPFQGVTNPITVLAAGGLLVNAVVLQQYMPNWWTGKLGGAAWMVLLPVLLVSLLYLLMPRRYHNHSQIVNATIGFTAILFVLLKTEPGLNKLAHQMFAALTGLPLKLALDPTDLLVLPFLGLAWWVLHQPPRQNRQHTYTFLASTLMLVALVADAPAPESRGVVCVTGQNSRITAITLQNATNYFGSTQRYTIYESQDSGVTWRFVEVTEKPPCTVPSSSIVDALDGSNPQIQYLLRSGNGIYRSSDGGVTFTREYEVSTIFYGAYLDRTTGQVYVAAGRAGLLIRDVEGSYQAIDIIQVAPQPIR
jgi:hypothetical protein